MYDPTVIKKDKIYYLFGTDNQQNLRLFFGDNLTKNNSFIEHPQSPLNSDKTKNRSAGSIFFYKGKLLRPTMNNLGGYGRGVNIQEIKELNKRKFSEITVKNLVFNDTLFENYFDSNIYHHIDPIYIQENGKARFLVDGAEEKIMRMHAKDILETLNSEQ